MLKDVKVVWMGSDLIGEELMRGARTIPYMHAKIRVDGQP